MKQLGEMFITKAMANGVRRETAVEVFSQLAGFATYGFCKSHAAAFALLAYQTMWLKLYHPAAFYCALLNHQPMGFYTPAVVMGDARRHGIAVLPPDLNRSQDACILEDNAVRLGLRYVKGLGPTARQCLLDQRKTPFQSLSDLCHRTRLPRDSIEAMILAGALDTLEIERRHLLWELHTLHYTPHTFDLAFDLDLPPLPSLSERETMSWNIERLGMSPGDHPLRLYRPYLQTHGILAAADVNRSHDGDVIKVAGQVVIRQRPATAKGHLFITLEDETGLANLIVRPHLYEKHHDVLRHAPLIYAIGRLQRQNDVCSILVFHVQELH